jgi:predicted Rossmann-fold nucleotide-binding protein
MSSFPIVALGNEYWEHLRSFIRRTMIDEGTISREDLELVTLADSPEQAVERIVRSVARGG